MLERVEKHELEVDPAVRVRVENDAGRIQVAAWEHHRVELVAEKHAPDEPALELLRVEFRGSAEELLVTYTSPEPVIDGWVDFVLRCPRMASLDLHNASGEIEVSGFHGPSRAATASGTIRAARMRGTATLTSASGEITGAALEGRVFARSASGAISLHGEMSGGHRVETASGPIQVEGVVGPIDVRSASGDISVSGALHDPSMVRTVSGDIRVRLMPGSQSEPTLETTSGQIDLQPVRTPGLGEV